MCYEICCIVLSRQCNSRPCLTAGVIGKVDQRFDTEMKQAQVGDLGPAELFAQPAQTMRPSFGLFPYLFMRIVAEQEEVPFPCLGIGVSRVLLRRPKGDCCRPPRSGFVQAAQELDPEYRRLSRERNRAAETKLRTLQVIAPQSASRISASPQFIAQKRRVSKLWQSFISASMQARSGCAVLTTSCFSRHCMAPARWSRHSCADMWRQFRL